MMNAIRQLRCCSWPWPLLLSADVAMPAHEHASHGHRRRSPRSRSAITSSASAIRDECNDPQQARPARRSPITAGISSATSTSRQHDHHSDDGHGNLWPGRSLGLSDDAGDCEDFVLLKRKKLIAGGFSPSDLLITVVRKPDGEGHAVLTLRTPMATSCSTI